MTRTLIESGIDWLGLVPTNWRITKIKSLFNISRGRVIPVTDMSNNYQYPVYSSQTKNEGIMGYIDTYDYSEPQITWTTDGANAGTVFLRKGKYNCTNICGILTPKVELDLRFLTYAIKHAAYYNKRPDTNGYKIMSNEMSNIRIAIPCISEQEKIANFLDEKTAEIDKIISNTEKSIEELEKYKQSLITETVTKGLNPNVPMKDCGIEWIGEIPEHWEVIKTKYLYDFGRGLNITKSDLTNEGIYTISYGDIHSRYGIKVDPLKDDLKCISTDYYDNEKNHKSLLEKGDVVFADTSEDIEGSGNFTIYLGKDLAFAGYHTIIIKPKIPLNYKYLTYVFDSIGFRNQIRSKVSGVKVYSITQNILKNSYLWLPPKKEQNNIVEYLTSEVKMINEIIRKKKETIRLLKPYKQSLIYEYVTGKKEVK